MRVLSRSIFLSLAMMVVVIVGCKDKSKDLRESLSTHSSFNSESGDGIQRNLSSFSSSTSTIVYQPDAFAGKDASLHTHTILDQEDTNFGSSKNCGTWASDGGGDVRCLIEFDLSGLPYPVASAVLQIHGMPRGQLSGIPNRGDVSAYQVTSAWQEMEVTWNNMPSIDPIAIDTQSPDEERWFEWNITDLYNSWKSGESANHGVMLINQLEGTRTTGIILNSSDQTADLELLPKLVLTYDNPVVEASVDIKPNRLNLKRKGRFVRALIGLPDGYDVEEIDINTVTLENYIYAKSCPVRIADFDDDGFPELMLKFDRQALIDLLNGIMGEVSLTVRGSFYDGMSFVGSDTIEVIKRAKKKRKKRRGNK